ncbi:MAG: hypothetical protein WC346_00140 [Methanogenium sp.]|jgi:membrane protein implicated in regulation of membrane protease activity
MNPIPAEAYGSWSVYVAPFFSAVSTGIILIFVNRMFSKRDSKDEEIAKLSKEKEELKSLVIKQAQDALSNTLCQVKGTVDRIEKTMSDKVDKADCVRELKDQWEAINILRDRVKNS